MVQLGFFVDTTRCTGCRTCQIACKDLNNLGVGALFREVTDFEGGAFPAVWAASLSLACNHCAQPQCLPNCPVAAITKDAECGLVLQDRGMCIGCERCVSCCPYHAPSYLADKMIVGKCDGCLHLLPGEESPVCVAACPTRSLHFGELDELRARFSGEGQGDASELVSGFLGIPSPDLTTPSLLLRVRPELLQGDAPT
jgi:anaerobic dimethyl sulfoxide reductase subunit B (iron-sulfur subunit)